MMDADQKRLYHIISTFIDINQEIFSQKSISDQLKILLRMLLGTIGIKRGAIFVREKDALKLQIAIRFNFQELPDLNNFSFFMDPTRNFFPLEEIKQEEFSDWVSILKEQKCTSILSLTAKNNFLGLITLGEKVRKEPYSVFEIHLLETLAQNFAVVINNFIMVNKLREANRALDKKVRQQDILSDIIKTINYEISLNAISKEVLNKLKTILSFNKALILKWAKSGSEILAEDNFGEEQNQPVDVLTLMKKNLEGLQNTDINNEILLGVIKEFCPLESGEDIFPYPLHQGNEQIGWMFFVQNSPFNNEELTFLDQVIMQLSVAFKNAELYEQAITDVLTGLFVRRFFLQVLEKEINRVHHYSGKFCLVFLDVDKFKTFNDTYGHDAGDEVLKMVAESLKSNARTSDTCVRYGGEEFVLLLPATNLDNAVIVSERLRTKIENNIVIYGEHELKVTASFGICEFPTMASDADELIKNADLALYLSKKNGRNRITIFDSSKQNVEKMDSDITTSI
ncbi:diguanylate cyclase [Candidatus Riflebacteria bacterium]